MSATTASAPPAAPSTATAAEFLAAFRMIVKRLERMPMPINPDQQRAWNQSHPAPRHVAALMQIVADEGMSVSTLAARLGVSLATASQAVTDLEAGSLVERFEDPTDRRRTLIRIGESHRDFARALLDTRLLPVQRALDRVRPAEQRAFVRCLELIAEELGNSCDV